VHADAIWVRGVLFGGAVGVGSKAADAEWDDAVGFVIVNFNKDGGVYRDLAASTPGALGVEVG
jgi:hypothetical protein